MGKIAPAKKLPTLSFVWVVRALLHRIQRGMPSTKRLAVYPGPTGEIYAPNVVATMSVITIPGYISTYARGKKSSITN
jgi:hypothetical protein